MTIDDLVKWPTAPGNYKYIQLYVDNTPLVLFGQNARHSGILSKGLDSIGIRYNTEIKTLAPGQIVMVVQLEGNRYRVSGMGEAKLEPEKKILTFYIDTVSADYELGWDASQTERLKQAKPDWEINTDYKYVSR